MKEKKQCFSIFLLLCLFVASICFFNKAAAQQPGDSSSDPIKIELITEEESVQPGHPFWVALHFTIDKTWHAYWKNPGDAGMPSAIEWKLPKGFTAGPIEWPLPHKFDSNSSSTVSFGYEGELWLLTSIVPPASLEQTTPLEIGANVEWLVCSDSTCLPGEQSVAIKLPVSTNTPKIRTEHTTSFAAARALLPKKSWKIQAQRKDGLIEVTMQAPAHLNVAYTEAAFFPEDKKSIDYKTDAILTARKDRPGTYVIALKEAGETNSLSLKGIIVLKTGTVSEALDIDIPIDNEEKGLEQSLSIADRHVPTDLSIATYQEPAAVTYEGGFVLALALAFAGGLILNLMPCVLPVISFKVLSFVKLSSEDRRTTLKHGAAFTFGVLLSFWVLAGLLLILQAYGSSVGWGFQLQEPLFVATLAALLLVFGLSLFGVFELGTSMTALASQANSHQQTGLIASFFSGILATAVATPCTGPFLGTAVGFAVTLSPLPALMIFTFLGLGMASPYLLLAAYPKLLRFMPKPGPWMGAFKEVLGFFMMATVVWLIWVFGAQTNSLGVSLLLGSFLLFAIGCWVIGKWGVPIYSKTIRGIGYGIAALCFAIGCYVLFNSTASWVLAYDDAGSKISSETTTSVWEPYSAERIAALQKQGIPVFVDFTAKWCLICQANHLVLLSESVAAKFNDLGVVRMKADWTRKDAAITEALRKFGRNGVPLYVLYGTDASKAPEILPQALTPDNVLQHLNKMENQTARAKS